MKLDRNELSKAVRVALSMGAVAAVGVVGTAQAQDQTAAQGTNQQPQTLQTIVVTGSHIRRVDLETSNPVSTISRQAIQQSGKLTLGDLVQEMPSVSGNANSPAVNNGGGTGGSFVSLRGLGSQRTLVLVDGHRILNNDLNTIPAELVERVEVLKDGASATYGSDAIGGVVNFIMRKNYQGAEFGYDYGISDRSDGVRKGAHFTFGQTSDKGSIIGGIDYNKFEGVVAGNRDYSKDALTLSGGQVVKGGSYASVSGLITAPEFSGCPTTGIGVPAGTFDPSAAGGAGIPAGFRCFRDSTSAPGQPNDLYNYQTVNLVLVPQERTNAYLSGTYNLTDNVQFYMDIFHNESNSNSQIAPLPFDMYGNLTLAPGQMYNPFGGAIGGGSTSASNPQGYPYWGDLAVRMTALGDRMSFYKQETSQVLAGLKGNIGSTSWQWDANVNYGHYSDHSKSAGYINAQNLQASGDLNADCATNSVDGCLNIFDQNDPNTAKILSNYLVMPFYNSFNVERQASLDVNGTLVTLPAGDMSLAVGTTYRKEYAHSLVDSIAVADANGNCALPNSACSSPIQGGYNVKEAYAELFIPVLKDLPFVRALNVTLGDRYSKYSLAGSTNNSKIAIEWRPIDDLMLRGTMSGVFRAPTIGNLYGGAAVSYDSYTNPCAPGGAAANPGHDVFCTGGGGAKNGNQIATIYSGAVLAGAQLSPESGKSFDYGVVYSPHFVPGLTLSADMWRVYLHNTIATADGQTAANICYVTNDPNNHFCSSIQRTPTGLITSISSPVTNLGNLYARGVDFAADYKVPQMSWLPGQFALSLEGTYFAQYDNDPTPGLPGDVTQHIAGKYNKQYGNFARWRALLGVNWNMGPWQAAYTLRYIGPFEVGSADPAQSFSGDASEPLVTLHYGSWTQSNVSVGYNIEPINTTLMIGVDNVFDKQPPVMFQNNTINANTDVNTFDTVGRFYWARAVVKF